MSLLYVNKTKDDILAKEELDRFGSINPENLKISHSLTRHNEEKHGVWDGLRGRITTDTLKAA
jgi:NAD(P)H-flavin reductase